jgi:hypothetical protein
VVVSSHTDIDTHNLVTNPTLKLSVSYRIPTAGVRVRARVWSCGICGGQSGTGAGFLRVLRFHLPIIPPIAPHSSPSVIILGSYNSPVLASETVDSVPLYPQKKGKRTRKGNEHQSLRRNTNHFKFHPFHILQSFSSKTN